MGLLDFIFKFIGSGKKNVQIIAQDLTKTYKESEALEVGLYSDKQPLVNKPIEIEINSRTYERTTDNNGIAKLNINLGIGKYKTLLTFKGDDEYKSAKGHVVVYINPIIETSDLNMSEKDGSKFVATLKDKEGNLLPNTKVDFKINGVLYSKVTNEQGQASLNINLIQGQYKIETIVNNISKENMVNISAPKVVETPSAPSKHFGYWVFGRDMLNTDLDDLKNNNVTDIFLNYYAFTAHGENKVLQWIAEAKQKNINTHIWMQSFYDGEWHNPKTTNLINKIQETEAYSKMPNVYGIHLDYLRYPGTAYKTDGGVEAINQFVRNVKDVIGDKFLSCAIMPENDNIYYYGQDAEVLGEYCDAVIPMQYKGNYSAGTSWLASTSKNFSSKANIWSGLQSYKSDDDTTVLSSGELLNDINICLENGAQGAILFRYGLSPNINFPAIQSVSDGKKSTKIEGTDMNMIYQDGSKYQCAVYDDAGRVAGTVNLTINGRTYARTPDSTGLYKLNINLLPGTYTITANYVGDANHEPSSVQNTIVINEKPVETPKQSYSLTPYLTEQGGGKLGQRTGYTCGPHSLMQCIYRVTGIELSEMELASICGTTTDGTDHEGLATGLAWFNRNYGYNLKMTWKNFSEVGFDGVQEYYENGAVFIHLDYRNQWGHYEVPLTSNTDPNKILNSLGDSCGNGYCGYIESRSKSTQQSYINGISQKSVCIITRE